MELMNENKICNKEILGTVAFMSIESGMLLYGGKIYISIQSIFYIIN